MLYKEYDEATLHKIQQVELGILKDFDELCSRYHLTYFMCGGSLIGTVRHQGFIPWDDDIDVGLPRADYEKFLRIARKKEFQEKYFILNSDTNPDYPLMTTRWCRKGTSFKEDAMKNVPGEFGIFLDVYAFDNIPDNDFLMKLHGWRTWFWGKLRIMYMVDEPVLYYGGLLGKLVTSVSQLGNRALHALHISPRFLYKHTRRVTAAYCKHATERVNYLHDPKPFLSTIYLKELLPVKRMPFEDLQVCVPADPDAYLSRRFGDYMTLPPEDKRHNHPPHDLRFEDEEV